MSSPRWNRLLAHAAEQRGLLASRQGHLAGLDPAEVRRRAHRDGWTRLRPGVWLVAGAPTPIDVRVRSAVLAVGRPVAVTRWTAAALHGLRSQAGPVQLVVPWRRRAVGLANVETLRSRTFDGDDVATVEGLPVVRPARMFADLAAVADRETLRSLLIDARQRGTVTLEQVVVQLLSSGNVRGSGTLRELVHDLDETVVDSTFERAVARWLLANGIAVVPQHRLETHRGVVHLDLAVADRRLAIECDGFAHHRTPRDLDRDHRRQNAIHTAGWRVLRLSWRRFHEDRAGFLEELRRLAAA